MYTPVNVDNVLKINSIYTAFNATYESNYSFVGEFHNFWEIVIVMDGEIGITAGSDVYVLKKGQAVLHEPMEFHSLWSESGTKPNIIVFSFDVSNMLPCTSKILQVKDLDIPLLVCNQITNSFEKYDSGIFYLKNAQNPAYHIAIKNLELFLLTTINEGSGSSSTLQTRSALNFAKAVTVLENNLDKNLSVPEIAHLCNIGEVNLKKIFSKYSGMGIMTYFNKLKITSAIQMLKEGSNVNETSAALGFSNQNYFSTVFKRITGHPPSYYK